MVDKITIEQIKAAHAKVRSGADFPNYIQDLKQMGLILYETYVTDGHTDYYDKDRHCLHGTAKYDTLVIPPEVNKLVFTERLKTHQLGKTDYLTFCNDCAKSGIEKWIVRLEEMTCTYYDKAGNDILVEKIPG